MAKSKLRGTADNVRFTLVALADVAVGTESCIWWWSNNREYQYGKLDQCRHVYDTIPTYINRESEHGKA